MLLLAGILAGGFCIWIAVKIGFYETWATLFNIVIAIYAALFLTYPIVDYLQAEKIEIPCCYALSLTVLAAGVFIFLHGITYILFTSQFKVAFPKIFDILAAGLLGFFGGFLILSFAALIILLTPLGSFAGINNDSVQYNMSSSYWLFDGIHTIVSPPDKELTTEEVIRALLEGSQSSTPEENSQHTEPDKPIKTNDA